MIRKAIILVLALAAVGTGALGVASWWKRFEWEIIDTRQSWVSVIVYRWRGSAYILSYNFDGQHLGLQQSLRGGAKLQHTMLRAGWTPGNPLRWHQGSFRNLQEWGGPTSRVRFVAVPLWPPLVLFLAYPVSTFAFRLFRRWRRRRRALCLECGYNLTGNISGVCPECGTEVERG